MRTCPAKCVAARELPHPCKQLSQPAAENCHPDDDVGRFDPARLDVVHREDERGGCEGEESECTGVGDSCGTGHNGRIWR